jgi:uncharacterized protein YfaS (alpha-2-macroglobulin family)
MTRHSSVRLSVFRLSFFLLLLSISAEGAQTPLRVLRAGPTGEIATVAAANEIRVVFSEPMIALGRVAPVVEPAFFRITPAVDGVFRWSGTTILIFTPAAPLPLATKYDVSIAGTAAALSGRTLGSTYTFSFITPTVRLLRTDWYRPGGRYDAAPIVALRFNQAVKPEDVLRHLRGRFESHPFTAAPLTQSGDAYLRANAPGSFAAYDRKIAQARAAASASSPVMFVLAREWDKERFVPAPDLVVLQATTAVPVESWVRVELDGRMPSPAGLATPGHAQSYTIKTQPAFLVAAMGCESSCDPDDRNPILFTAYVKTMAFGAALRASDVTDARRPRPLRKGEPPTRPSWQRDESSDLTVEDAGFQTPAPSSTWLVTLPPTLQATDGQTLGYTWAAQVDNWHQRAFTSFGDGHGVWEKGGGAVLPFYARNMQNVKQWAAPVEPQALMSTLLDLQHANFRRAPETPAMQRRLGLTPDRIQSHGLDLSGALKPSGNGLVWAAVEEGDPIAQSRAARSRDDSAIVRSTLVQVTNLAISVKDSPQNTLLFVTRLDTAAPVAGARVSIVTGDGETRWTGTTGPDGVAMAPAMRLRSPKHWYNEFAFIATAEKDGDVAYTGSDWYDGMLPWAFDLPFDLEQADPLLCGTVFTDRGVYKLGEEVHAKAILRSNTPAGVRLLPQSTAVEVWVKDDAAKTIDRRTITVNAWSAADFSFTVPADGSLGRYAVHARLAGAAAARPAADPPDEAVREPSDSVTGSFLVAAYRRPDFRVDVKLDGDSRIAGDPLNGVVTARYLFGASMGARPLNWTFTRTPVFGAPAAIVDKFPSERWTFVGLSDENRPYRSPVAADQVELTPAGNLALTLDTDATAGRPYSYTLEGDVEDVSRQHIANRASLLVHPAPWYIGVKSIPYFVQQKNGLETELVAAGLDGRAVAGVGIDLTLTQIQWHSVRRAEGNGFYGWETERKEVPSGSWHVTSGSDPVAFAADLAAGGYYILTARAEAGDGRSTETRTGFYALGAGYTAWQRYDHNRIDLVPERTSYRPGETATIMIQSPWEQATALVTTEREGVRTHRQFALTSTQQSIDVPITNEDVPNVYVSVLLVKGRSKPLGEPISEEDASDPGKPSFRLGYVQLKVENAARRLDVKVTANRDEYRPAAAAKVSVDVKDHQGSAAQSEVTLWAVDYGVLSLTAYQTPDVLDSVYVEKALQVLTEDGRQKIVSRRVVTPKGDAVAADGLQTMSSSTAGERTDFRVMAFWLASVVTDARGHASVDVKLPESLTTYRIMAVAGDRESRFGSANAEIRVNKPITLKAAFPRFLAVGDKASFGAVLTNQLAKGGTATVAIESLDPQYLRFARDAPQTVSVAAGGSVEVRFDAAGVSAGRARVRMTANLGGDSDAFQDLIPVEVLVSPETVSAIGQADDAGAIAAERLTIPAGVVPTFGGLHVDLASTALVGLGEGARYLVEYPYGCAEQRGSRALALMLAADLGDAFRLPGIEPAKAREIVQTALRELEHFQCEDSGGFAYWPGDCRSTSAYLTAYLLHVFKVAADLKYTVDPRMVDRASAYLESELAQKPPEDEGWWPAYTAWQAFAVKVLVEGGRRQDSHVTRLYGYRDRMPVFGLSYLNDALVASGEGSGVRSAELRRMIGNAILPEAATSHVEELNDPYLLWFWNSNVRSTAIVLNSLVKAGTDAAPYRGLVTWLLQVRRDGRWNNTQENALALEALVSYYRRFEATVPDFTATASLAASTVATARFQGRSTDARSADIPMSKIVAVAPAGTEQPLTFTRNGKGTLFYSARLRYAVDALFQDGMDQGIAIARSYAPFDEGGSRPASTTFKAGDLVRVTLTLRLTKERRYVAVTDPLPAGLEPLESWFATSARELADAQESNEPVDGSWFARWQRGGFDHVERHDDRVALFATRLSEGEHVFTYIARATTAGTFRTAPAHAEEMYEPEVFGRTATAVLDIRK